MIFWLKNNIIALSLAASIMAFFLLIINFFFFLKLKKINKKLKKFLSGKNGKDLEGFLMEQNDKIRTMDKEIQDLFDISGKIHQLSFRGMHKTGLIRFNPFKDIGGDQSFAIALLDGKNSGLLISSLHTKEGTRVYAKPVVQGKPTKYLFTEEEKQAIQMAILNKMSKI